MDPNFSCPPDFSCTWNISISQNIPSNHVGTMNMLLGVVGIICIAIILVAFAMVLWEKLHN